MRAAVLENNTVVNIIEIASLDTLPDVLLVDADNASIGDTWDGTQFIKPTPSVEPVVVPQSVTRRQAIQVLINHGLLANVQPVIDSLDDGTPEGLKAKQTAQNEWDNSTEFLRGRPLVIQIGGAIGLDATGLDDLFIEAATL